MFRNRGRFLLDSVLEPIEHSFLDEIIENLQEDGPRLVYADWLAEHGQEERAEFIRLQCQIARDPSLARTYSTRLGQIQLTNPRLYWEKKAIQAHWPFLPPEIGHARGFPSTLYTNLSRDFLLALPLLARLLPIDHLYLGATWGLDLSRFPPLMGTRIGQIEISVPTLPGYNREDFRQHLERLFPGVTIEVTQMRVQVEGPTLNMAGSGVFPTTPVFDPLSAHADYPPLDDDNDHP